MSIFQKSVIKNYLAGIDRDQLEKAYQVFQKNYSPRKTEKIRKLKEEEYQDGFLRDIFVNVLGYTLKPDDNFNLVREFKNQSDGKKADGAILKNDKAKAVIELKSTKTKDLKTITEQAFNYKNNQPECKYVITSNFQKLRLYIDYAHEYEEFDLFRLTKQDFERMFLILCRESILNDTPEKLKKESVSHEESVSKQLYADYSVFRKKLFENLTKNNPTIDKLTLFSKTQALIDRFLFILFAEDKGLLPPNSVNRIIERFDTLKEEDAYKPLYEIYKQYFGYMNIGRKGKKAMDDIPAYNGGLFYPDKVLYDLKIDDDILINDLQKLSAYDFDTEVDVNILGHIFEHSLSEIEKTTAKLKGTDVDKTKSKRKKDGIFYTPRYITRYIVDNTVGRLCEEKRKELDVKEIEFDDSYYTKKGNLSKKGRTLYQKLEDYKKWLLSLKILDPACGSGAFLNQALTFLIREHNFIIEVQTDLKKGQVSMFNIEKAVLENNLYGVDVNEESVEITKLSLWLRTANRERKLSNLNSNIRCGNSLIDDPEIAGDKAFKWEDEFSGVMESGGFDVVIGNPPYGASFLLKEKEFISKNYKGYQYKFESYIYFYEKGISLIKEKGYLSFITPELFLRLEKSENIRQFLYLQAQIIELKFVGENVFQDVKINSAIVTITKAKNPFYKAIKIINQENPIWYYSYERWEKTPYLKINYEISPQIEKIIYKIENSASFLENYGEAIQGITPYDSYKGHSKELIKQRAFHFKEKIDESCGKWLDGKHINRYSLIEGEEWLRYGSWLAAPREKHFFENPRLLFREVPGQNRRIQATYTEGVYYHGHSITPFILKEKLKEKLLVILCIVNSKLLSWYIKYKSSNFSKDTFPKINPRDIKELPVRNVLKKSQLRFIEKADIMLSKNKELHELKNDFLNFLKSELIPQKITKKLENWNELDWDQFEKEIKKCKVKELSLKDRKEWQDYFIEQKEKSGKLKSVIDSTDREIDQMVYELYGLTKEEMEIVEKRQAKS